jgi:hypothetical protein
MPTGRKLISSGLFYAMILNICLPPSWFVKLLVDWALKTFSLPEKCQIMAPEYHSQHIHKAKFVVFSKSIN